MTYGPNAVLQVSVFLKTGGTSYPVVSAVVEYALNQIPIARVQLPSGMDVNGKFVDITKILGSANTDCSLVVEGKGQASLRQVPSYSWPLADFSIEIFKGRLLSYSASISTTGAAIDVVIVDKLYALDNSSFASGDFDKSAPDDWFTYDETEKVALGGGVVIGGKRVEDVDFVEKDWWNDIIKPALIYKAGLPLKKFTDQPPPDTANAIEQLNAIKGSLLLTPDAKEAIRSSPAIQKSINGTIGNMILTGEGGSSAFDKILSIATMFGCVLIPYSPGNVHIVPYTCMDVISGDFYGYRELYTEEIDFGSKTPNPVIIPSGIVLVGSATNITKTHDTPQTINTGFVGKYVIEKAPGLQLGPLMVESIPAYLTGLAMNNGRIDSGILEKKLSITSLSSIPPSSVSPPNPLTGPSLANAYGDLFAKMRYFTRLYEANTQDILSGFRLDVSLGQPLEVRDSTSGALTSGGIYPKVSAGKVESVSYVFSQSRITTSWRIRHAIGQVELDAFEGKFTNTPHHTLFNVELPPDRKLLWPGGGG